MAAPMTSRRHQDLLYDAESWSGIEFTSRRYPTIREARARLFEICESDWYLDRYAHLGKGIPPVERIRSRRWAGISGQDGIGLRDLNDAVLIHELAHWVAPADEGHGRAFVVELLALVREFMGFRAYADLRNGLERVGYYG